jgi:hypothetical protein
MHGITTLFTALAEKSHQLTSLQNKIGKSQQLFNVVNVALRIKRKVSNGLQLHRARDHLNVSTTTLIAGGCGLTLLCGCRKDRRKFTLEGAHREDSTI